MADSGLLLADPGQRDESPRSYEADNASASAFGVAEISSKASVCIYCELTLLGFIAYETADDPVFSAVYISDETL